MKYILPLIIAGFFFACKEKTTTSEAEDSVNREDLSLMNWIEGNWVGDYHGQPFYETYKMVNDSTISITTYLNVGTDSATFTQEFIFWEDGAYFMGEGSKYKVVKLDTGEIKMIPLKANNEIYWKRVDDSTWAAELAGKSDTAYYILRKVSPQIDSMLMAIQTKGK